MNVLTLLKGQHKEVSALYAAFEKSDDKVEKLALFNQIADHLAVHATIEERHFYPAVRERDTLQEITEAYDEHLEVKKLLVDCLQSTKAPGFDGKVAALMGAVDHHVDEEENELFPKVRNLLSRDALEALGQTMEAEGEQIKALGAPRRAVKVELERPAAML